MPLVEHAVQQGVGPLLHSRLKARSAALPPAAAERLREAYLDSAALNMRLFHERDRILAALKAPQVSAVPVKGASIAKTLYDDAAQRPMADIDLWVRRPQAGAARSVMESLGYAAHAKADRPPALQDELLGETQMVKAGAPLVELHWSIFPGEWLRHTARVDEEAIWERSTGTDGEGERQLSPEDTVVHLCVHLGVNHQMSGIGLRTLVDLDHARRKWTIDWAVVAQRAREWRVACATWLVLNALAKLFGDPNHELPLADLAPSAARRRMLNRLASPGHVAGGLAISSGPMRFLFLLVLVDRARDAARLLWRALYPDRLWLTLRYEKPDATAWRVGLLRTQHLLNLVRTGEL